MEVRAGPRKGYLPVVRAPKTAGASPVSPAVAASNGPCRQQIVSIVTSRTRRPWPGGVDGGEGSACVSGRMAVGSDAERRARNARHSTQRTMIDDRQGTPMPAAKPLALYAAALVALSALAACSGGDPVPSARTVPAASSTAITTSMSATTTQATATPTVDPVIAKIPAAARPETESGAQSFARHFFDSLNHSAVRAEPQILDGLFSSDCKTCVAMHDSITELKREGRHHAGPTVKIVSVSTSSFVDEKRVVLVQVDQRAVDVLDGKGKKVDRTLADRGTFAVTLGFSTGHWVVSRLQTVARPS